MRLRNLRNLRNTVRLRLTVIFGVVVVVSGLAVLAATYGLVRQSVEARFSKPISISTGIAVPVDPQSPSLDVPPTDPLARSSEVRAEIERRLNETVRSENDAVLQRMLFSSGIAMLGILVLAVAGGWFLAGRMLRPLRTLTASVNSITHHDLHRRLNAEGPSDEIRELSDTFDGLLDRLEGSFEAQRRFVANASHELRTPLARQRVLGQVALGSPRPTIAELRAAHERILEAGQEQARILDSLLTLARGQQHPEEVARCDLRELVTKVLAERPGDGLKVTRSLDQAEVDAHPDLIRRLVVNLVDNAIAHNVSDGWIEITTAVHTGRSLLVVSNSGPVIDADQIPHLIEPFRRLGVDRTHHDDPGLGLGLSIVAAVAESHGAALSLEPGMSGGLVVTVAFPQAPKESDLDS